MSTWACPPAPPRRGNSHDHRQDQPVGSVRTRHFEAQPFSRFVGAELTDVSADSAEIRIRNRADLQHPHGFLHGGVISYLADNPLTFAGGLALGGDALTAKFKINYIKPATGDVIIARAKTLAITRRQAVCQCSIYSDEGEDERLVAVAQGTIVAASRDRRTSLTAAP